MPPRFTNLPKNRKLNYDREHIIECSHYTRDYLLVWVGKEWNYVKDWIPLAEFAVRKSHPKHGDVELLATLWLPQCRRTNYSVKFLPIETAPD